MFVHNKTQAHKPPLLGSYSILVSLVIAKGRRVQGGLEDFTFYDFPPKWLCLLTCQLRMLWNGCVL